MSNKFSVFWLTGRSELLKGSSISSAFNNAGYSAGALRALDFYAIGDVRDKWEWDKKEKRWSMIPEEK